MPGQSKRIVQALCAAALALPLQGGTDHGSNVELRLLAAHNRERNALGVPALRWNDELAASAAKWGQHLKKLGYLEHYPDDPDDEDPEGENLWAGTRGYYGPEDMVGLWIAEKKHFRHANFPANSKTGDVEDIGHYTQLIWRTSTHVGCAVTRNDQDDFLVCRYSEAGNVIGERPI